MRRLPLLLWPLVVAAALLLAALLTHGPLGFLVRPCPLRMLTGMPCPTCGGVHATRFLFEGSVGAAFQANPMIAGGIIVSAASALAALALLPWAARVHLPSARAQRGVWIAVLVLIVLNWAYLILR